MDNQTENQEVNTVQTPTPTPVENQVQTPVQPQPEKKKKMTLPIKIMIIGCILGLVVAGIGCIKQISANKINAERKQAAMKASDEAVDAANKRLDEIAKEYEDVKTKYSAKSAECDAIVPDSPSNITKISTCRKEEQELQQQLWELESEDSMIKAQDYGAYYQTVDPMTYRIFYIIGASIAGLALLGAFIIYLVKGDKTYK